MSTPASVAFVKWIEERKYSVIPWDGKEDERVSMIRWAFLAGYAEGQQEERKRLASLDPIPEGSLPPTTPFPEVLP